MSALLVLVERGDRLDQQRLLVAPGQRVLEVQDAEVVPGVGVVGVDLQGPLPGELGLIEPALPSVCGAQVQPRGRKPGGEAGDLVESRPRGLEVANLEVHVAEVVECLDVVRVLADRLVEPGACLDGLPLGQRDLSHQVEGLGVGPELEHAVEDGPGRGFVASGHVGPRQELHRRDRCLCPLEHPAGALHRLLVASRPELRLCERQLIAEVVRVLLAQVRQLAEHLAGSAEHRQQSGLDEPAADVSFVLGQALTSRGQCVVDPSLPHPDPRDLIRAGGLATGRAPRQSGLCLGASELPLVDHLAGLPGQPLARTQTGGGARAAEDGHRGGSRSGSGLRRRSGLPAPGCGLLPRGRGGHAQHDRGHDCGERLAMESNVHHLTEPSGRACRWCSSDRTPCAASPACTAGIPAA